MAWIKHFSTVYITYIAQIAWCVEVKWHLVIKLFFFSFSGPELPDRGQNDAAQQSQVYGEWRYWLRSQAPSHV